MRIFTIAIIFLFIALSNHAICQEKGKSSKKNKKEETEVTKVEKSAKDDPWQTYYEKSGFKETPSYDETIEYCRKLAEASEIATFKYFGKSPEGRNLPLMIVDIDGYTEAREVKQTDRIVVLIQAGIHAGEIDGKDAGMMLMRDILIDKKYRNVLRNMTILFIPIYNVDGHEHFGPYNRINQNGPDEMGWRTTSTNLNLNRDYLKADAPETQEWVKLFINWLPDFFIDIHATDGADYQYVLTYGLETYGNMTQELTNWQTNNFLQPIEKKMEKSGFPIFPYVAFKKWHDPRSGLRSWVASPMLSTGYTAIQNRPGLLIENHMLKDYKTRVSATYEMLGLSLEILNKESYNLKQLVKKADEYYSSDVFRNKNYTVKYKMSGDSVMIDFKGVEYDIVKSDLTGGNWFQYHTDKPKTFKVPFFNTQIAEEEVDVPEAYIIPAQWEDVIKNLELHGVSMEYLRRDYEVKVSTYKFSDIKFSDKPYEGRQTVNSFDYKIIEEERVFSKGSAVVDMAQPGAQVILHILEPKAPSSYLYWGFFNSIFEQKEYSETYVMETMAREMLKNDPELKKEYETKIKEDEGFAKNQWAQLNWFYSKSKYWDDRINTYPVGKIMDTEIIEKFEYR